jgi:hypothetical protein
MNLVIFQFHSQLLFHIMMKLYLIFLIFALSFCSQSRSQSSSRDINEVIFHALDVLLREELRKGNEHFPVLAPFESFEEFITFRVGHLVNLTGVAKNVYIDGLDGYHVIDSRFSKLTMRLAFDIVWPQVLMTGWYNLDGRFGGLIPIYGQGNYRIDLKSEKKVFFRFFPFSNINVEKEIW